MIEREPFTDFYTGRTCVLDDPFPKEMMPEIERFFRDVHPTLKPGQDIYPEVFASPYFFPLQRQRELARMVQLARKVSQVECVACNGRGSYKDDYSSVTNSQGQISWKVLPCQLCKGTCNTGGPVTVMEIGTDKGGGLYHWCMSLPTVKNVIACEIRGTPYATEFSKAFSGLRFIWYPTSSQNVGIKNWVKDSGILLDVLFIDGDKLGFKKDFDLYRPLVRKGGIIFLHDIRDRGPKESWEEIIQETDLRYETIIDIEDSNEAMKRERDNVPCASAHEGWLRHWRGRSCGVGVVYV